MSMISQPPSRALRRFNFTTNGTYTPTPGARWAYVKMWGAGAGGNSTNAVGGNAGAYCEFIIDVSSGAGVAYTVGVGGTFNVVAAGGSTTMSGYTAPGGNATGGVGVAGAPVSPSGANMLAGQISGIANATNGGRTVLGFSPVGGANTGAGTQRGDGGGASAGGNGFRGEIELWEFT